MLLHTINKSPYRHQAFESCIKFCREQDAILLIEDAVYGVDHPLLLEIPHVAIYALDADLIARGLTSKYADQKQVTTASYEDFVSLCIKYTKQKNW